jgi:hypothetical protein
MIEGDFRDGDNNVVPAILPDPTTIVVDCDDPVFTVNGPADGGFYNTAPVLDIQASDNCDIDDIYYQVDGCAGGPWTPIVTDFAGAAYSNAAWALPDFASLSEANHCIYFKVIDDNTRGNADSCTFTWCFTKDVTPPDPPTDFTAEPRHNAIELAWTNSVSTDAIGVQIQRVPWGDYPEYTTAAPGYPADQTIGTTAYDGTDESYRDDADFDNTNRDIYYYGAFAYDAAGNYSAATTSAQARATSYWLGDVAGSGGFGDYDGFVYAEDLGPLTVSYGKTDTDPGWNAELDYGPTWDDATSSPGGATDIPIPDDSVNFEDGIIFAINFDAVNPTMKTVPLLAGKEIDGPLAVHLVNYGDGVYGLELNNNIGEVKGFSVELTLNNNQTTFERVELAETITNTEALTFAKALPGENSLTFDFLLLGNGRTIGGSGPIATLHFAGTDPQVELANADVRDNDNKEVTVELIQTSPADLVPNEYRLSQNYPNPFNPTTTIDFNVRSQGHVTLEVYNALGQRVKTLVDEVRDAGQHSVMWDGTDVNGNSVASGMYLYRLTINSFSDTRKMMLLK